MTSTAGRLTGLAFRDTFDDDRAPGTVVGSTGPAGVRRRGVDAEGLIGIDHGRLRLRPLARPGWGREGIAYGPFPRIAGLTMAARVLNGHNSSQTFYFPETRRQRLRRIYNDAR
ncbi:MAG: nucleotide-binding protein, partial [Acidimicrobiia bacterium]